MPFFLFSSISLSIRVQQTLFFFLNEPKTSQEKEESTSLCFGTRYPKLFIIFFVSNSEAQDDGSLETALVHRDRPESDQH